MKKSILNYIISFLLLILAITFIWFVNRITTPHILESDLIKQCKDGGGNYSVYQYDGGAYHVYCELPQKNLFDLELTN